MTLPKNSDGIVNSIKQELITSKTGNKRLKVKSLMKKFNFQRRTEENTSEITQLLENLDININPSIMKLGDHWELSSEDWIYLSIAEDKEELYENQDNMADNLNSNWEQDEWFVEIVDRKLRTEKEVETKFIIPLLKRLGYSEDDRYDDMSVPIKEGSKTKYFKCDFALFNKDLESLNNQVLLLVEAKNLDKFNKSNELKDAKKQVKYYAFWTGCDFSIVTDGRIIEVDKVAKSHIKENKLLFSCEKKDLKNRFKDLYRLISKERLTKFYLSKQNTTEEISQNP